MKSIAEQLRDTSVPSEKEHEDRVKRLLERVGVSPDPKRDEEIAEYERQKAIDEKRLRFEKAQVPTDVKALLLAGEIEETPATSAVKALLASSPRKRMLVLAGPAGTGKTVAACIALLEQGGRFARATQVASSAFRRETLEEITKAFPVLVLDDLGREFANDATLLAIDEVIGWRYDQNYLTIITTNLSADVLRDRYEERVATRLQHRGVFIQLGAGEKCFRTRDVG